MTLSEKPDMLYLLRSVERVTVTRVEVTEGEGVVGNPIRTVTYWYDDSGQEIQRHDPVEEMADA